MKKRYCILMILILILTISNISVAAAEQTTDNTIGQKPSIVTDQNKEEASKDDEEIIPPAASIQKMVDVSKWDGRVNWKKVRKSGIQHAILRIGYGKRYGKGGHSDYMFSTNYKSAKKSKIKCGIYFFSYAKTVSQAKAEAKYCLKLMKKNKITPKSLALPVVFDLEYDPALKTGKKNCTNMTVAFCDIIKKAGYDPMVYTSGLHYNKKLDYDKIKKYKIWVANYKVKGPIIKNPYDMWQYTSTGKVPGIHGYCDISYMYSHYVEATKITIPAREMELKKGQTKKIKATIFPPTATNKRIIWTTSNKKIVKILDDQKGLIQVKKKGTAYLTVKTASGVKEKVKIVVK